MNLKRIIIIFLFAISNLTVNGQDILDISKKMSFPANLPIPRFTLPLSDTLNGVSLRMDDFSSITPQKLNLVKDVSYVELCFSSQSDLNTLVGLLSNFKRLKYLKFSDNAWASKVSATPIILPNEISICKNVVAVSFSGNWQIDYSKSMEILHQLPNLSYFFFENIKQEIPTELSSFVNVKGLSLYNNNSLYFPEWITSLSKLESISISLSQYRSKGDNYLNYSAVFQKLQQFNELKSLYISYFNDDKGKYHDVAFKNLKKIKLNGSYVSHSSAFFKFLSNHKNLNSIELQGVTFDTLSRDMLSLKKLEELSIQGLKRPLVIDFNLKELKKLKVLKVSNYLNLPADLYFPSSLLSLNLSDNSMVSFPIHIGKLTNLRHLDLSYCAISNLPDDLSKLKKLTHLDLSGNQINELPDNFSEIENLKALNLKANPLQHLPVLFSQLKNLSTLDISFGDLKALPENFGDLQNLKILNLASNYVRTLPISFTQLKNLESVNLSDNNIINLPADLGKLIRLNNLNLGANNIAKLPMSIGSLEHLEDLNLSANSLIELPEELGLLNQLKNVWLDNDLSSGRNNSSIREIYRKGSPKPTQAKAANTFKNLPKNLTNWTNLRRLSISNYTTLDDVALFKSLFTIRAKGFIVDAENASISTLPLKGWADFGVKELNLRTNKLTAIPADIVNAPYLESYNFNNNRLPFKPINLNSYAANRYQKLLWFKEFGFIDLVDLPKVDSMVLALVEKSSNHYYREEFKYAVEYANRAIGINKELALQKFNKTNLGEAYYETGNYQEAVYYLTAAIKRDTVGPVRIMNFITPDFDFRAKSYLKLGDTLKAIDDYKHLAQDFRENVWGDIGLLYSQLGDKSNAKQAFTLGVKRYQEEISFGEKQKQDVELLQLSLLELYCVSEEFSSGNQYAETLSGEIKNAANKTLLAYLKACVKIGANRYSDIDLTTLETEMLRDKKNITRWSYDLIYKWLRVTKIEKDKEKLIRRLTDLIKP